jgi:hypothetical protein
LARLISHIKEIKWHIARDILQLLHSPVLELGRLSKVKADMSIYNLPTSDEQLSSWVEKTQHAGTQQHAAIANVVGDMFGNQDIRIPFLVAGNRWWLPSKSYVRMRIRVTNGKGDGPPLLNNSSTRPEIAPTMGFCASLFQSCEFAIRGVTVSRLTDFVPQADQYWKRTQKSYQWMKTIGESVDFEELGFDERRDYWQNQYASSGFVNTRYSTLADYCQLNAPGVGVRNNIRFTFTPYVSPYLGTPPPPALAGRNATVRITQEGNEEMRFDVGTRFFFRNGRDPTEVPPFYSGTTSATFHAFTITAIEPTAQGFVYSISCENIDSLYRYAGGLSPQYDQAAPFDIIIRGDYAEATGGINNDFGNVLIEYDERVTIEPFDGQAFEVCWQPPLSIFGLNHALPSMSCELILKARPGVNYSIAGISTRPATYTTPADPPRPVMYGPSASADSVRLYVDNLYFYSYQMESDRLDDGTFMLDLSELNVTTQNLQRGNASMQQLNFLVPPSTYQVGIAFQDSRAGTTTQVPFTQLAYHQNASQVAGGFPPIQGSQNIMYNNTDLTRLFCQYGNRTFPQPDAEQAFRIKGTSFNASPNGVAYQTQRWLESAMATGQYWAPGGPEPFQVWLTKGPLYVFPTLRDPTDRSTNLVVNAQFSNTPPAANCFVFTMSRKVATIRVANGAVQEVDVQDQ